MYGSMIRSLQVLLGLSGVVIVGFSVLGAMGVCSAFGVKSTLIIVEVIPFLVLAVRKEYCLCTLSSVLGVSLFVRWSISQKCVHSCHQIWFSCDVHNEAFLKNFKNRNYYVVKIKC